MGKGVIKRVICDGFRIYFQHTVLLNFW